jgi:hypothetical protein
MGAIEELKERIEHAGHHDGHDPHKSGVGKPIGVTMAILGVLLAVCAALLGAERTELIRTTVEQSNRFGVYQAETMKYRVIQADYELLKAISPKPAEIARVNQTLRAKRAASGKEDSEDTAEIKDLIASATEDMAELLTPDVGEKERFQKMALRYKHDMAEAKEDAEAYDLKIKAHEEGAEGYERAQVAAEIGIVVASVALLLSSRAVWVASILLALSCAGLGGMTFSHTRSQLEVAEHKINEAVAHTIQMEKEEVEEDAASGGAKPEAPKHAPGGEHGKDPPRPPH